MGAPVIRAFSERLTPPFSGQIQIAESEQYRALTLDGQVWEIQHVNRTHVRVATMNASEIKSHALNPELLEEDAADEKIIELLNFLSDVTLPFPAADCFECWLLDPQDESPLAMVFSCTNPDHMQKFPERPEWTALPAAVMPIVKTDEEQKNQTPPVNYQVERLVAERAGVRLKPRWFNRKEHEIGFFPPFLVREDWPEESQGLLCSRYIERQAPRLLMLHDLSGSDRRRLEGYCRPNSVEVARFHTVYPEIVDEELIQALRVEARFRSAAKDGGQLAVNSRRDGILYI